MDSLTFLCRPSYELDLLRNMSHSDDFYDTSNKVSFEWKIKNFRNRTYRNDWLDSPKFLLSKSRFFIRIHPNGSKYAPPDWISLYLRKKSSQYKHHIELNLGIKRADGTGSITGHCCHLFPSGDQTWGWDKFIDKYQLINCQDIMGSDGILTIVCEARVLNSITESASQTSSFPYSGIHLSENLEELYDSQYYSDVKINVNGKKFLAHRSILCVRSSVFRSMFELDMKESKTGEINITDCDPEAFGSFLRFLYSGKLDVVTSSNAFELYSTAGKYNVQDLRKACCECMARSLCVDSVCDVLHLAALHDEKELLTSATEYFMNNGSGIVRSPKWQNLSELNPSLVNELVIKLVDKLSGSL